jgi:teichuronic acid biosynthesis glycosyltransferase TuaH
MSAEARGVDGRPLIVVSAGTAWDGMAGSDRMLASAMARYAHVLWVDPPFSALSRAKRPGGRLLVPTLSAITPEITRVNPVVLPLHTRAGVRHTTPWLIRAQIKWALRRLGARPHAVVDCRMGRALGGWGKGVHNVLYGTDDFVAGAELMGRRVAQVREEERQALAGADLVLAVSTTLVERWRGMGAKVLHVPNGVRPETYASVDRAAPADDVDLPAPVAGVVGHLSNRIDISLLEAVVEEGCSLLLVGRYDARWEPERFVRLQEHPRVTWVGPRRYEELVGYLRLVDVGLTPYTETAFNHAAFPLKTLEYLAAGRPVVSTDLPATRWLGTDLVSISSDPAEFAKTARELALRPRTPELVAARRAFTEQHSWQARAELVAAAIGLA